MCGESMGYTNTIIGAVLIAVALALLGLWPDVFFWPMVTIIAGAVAPVLAVVGLAFLLFGGDK